MATRCQCRAEVSLLVWDTELCTKIREAGEGGTPAAGSVPTP